MITFTVNGEKIDVEQSITISDYLKSIGIDAGKVVVELNFEIPDRNRWTEILINSGDNIEIVKFIGGG